ncbi:MAG: thiamine pyrophosphate-binding protein [bacterium]|nr:thiamine pyrophosphate-binding protein [bacterium]
MSKITFSDLLVSYLEILEVKYVFGVPGGALNPLFEALDRSERRGGVKLILTRHENGAAYMADGYARETGKLGVCCATTGPGATNFITGVSTAYSEHIPILAITPQTAIKDFGFGTFQDSSPDGFDIMNMFGKCTYYNSLITHTNQFEKKVVSALTTALSIPKGPVHLSIPAEILNHPFNSKPTYNNLNKLISDPNSLIDKTSLDNLIHTITKVISENKKIALHVDFRCSEIGELIMKFAEIVNAEIVTTPTGKKSINPYHPLYRGVFGFSGHSSARKTMENENLNLIISIASDMNEWGTCRWDSCLLNKKLVHIDNKISNFRQSPMAQSHIYGDFKTVFSYLIDNLGRNKLTEKYQEQNSNNQTSNNDTKSEYIPKNITINNSDNELNISSYKLPKPSVLIEKIVAKFPNETRYYIDNSNSIPWTIHHMFLREYQNYNISIGFAPMGWAIGAASGSGFGNKKNPTVCFTGDGCFLMSGTELSVIVEHNLPVVIIVLKDGLYGMIKQSHDLTGEDKANFSIPETNFCLLAESLGANSIKITCEDDLEKIDFNKIKMPVLIEVLIDSNEKAPLGMC